MNEPTNGYATFPRGVSDPFCPDGCPITTPTDHRLLWHLECVLAVDAPTGSRLDEVRQSLRRYLNQTCQHHWHHSNAEGDIDAHWQCLWCNDVLWHPDQPGDGQTCASAEAHAHG